MLIREVILENFMSYEYGRVRLKPGLNILCGPNGSGKSSVLLGISVALGQAYTERGRRLRDLIRHGKDIARVTLILDNSPREGVRPIPGWRSDTFRLSRTLRIDGEYRFQVNGKPVSKAEVVEILERFGINPDNMLLIMHQGMVSSFAYVSPQEKLSMLEEAVGLSGYRRNVLEARDRLTRLLEEEKALDKLMEDAKRSLEYWDEEHRRYLEKVRLQRALKSLKEELLWAQVYKTERDVENLRSRVDRLTLRVKRLEDKELKIEASIEGERGKLNELKGRYKSSLKSLISYERALASTEASISLLSKIEELAGKLNLEGGFLRLIEIELDSLSDALPSLRRKTSSTWVKVEELREGLESLYEDLTKLYVDKALTEERRVRLLTELGSLKRRLKETEEELSSRLAEASKVSRVETARSAQDILNDIRVAEAKLEAIGDVSEDTRLMYERQLRLMESLKDKMRLLRENIRAADSSLRRRMSLWRRKVESLLEEVNRSYQAILSALGARGYVKLANPDNIDEAGLTLYVGFRGLEPTPLNPYTQSGGERSVAVAAFLLALQRYVKSPFRAVDEFEVHMDIRNREIFLFKMIEVLRRSEGTQYLVITPNQIPVVGSDVHVIVVQNVYGASEVVEVAQT